MNLWRILSALRYNCAKKHVVGWVQRERNLMAGMTRIRFSRYGMKGSGPEDSGL
jgi:hypothetical protein